MTIYFYKQYGELGYLASYSDHGFYLNGVFYKTVEHYYQSEKVSDSDVKEKIIAAATPKEASIIGRDRSIKIKKDWDNLRNDVMYKGVYEKFKQNKDIQIKLLQTGTEDIVEETVDEYYWGCGKKHTGENNFGIILCKVREQLRNEEG